jgi:hypothetical protein
VGVPDPEDAQKVGVGFQMQLGNASPDGSPTARVSLWATLASARQAKGDETLDLPSPLPAQKV